MIKMEYVTKAHFIYDKNSKHLIKEISNNPFGTLIAPISVEDFIANLNLFGDGDIVEHIVISMDQHDIPEILAIAYRYDMSVAIIPLPTQVQQIKNLCTSPSIKKNIEIALRDDAKSIDLVKINDELIYNQVVIGRIPMLNSASFFTKMQKFEIMMANGRKIVTAGSALVILNHTKEGFISRIFDFQESMRDGKITLVIISPSSIYEYIKLMLSFRPKKRLTKLPESIGYLKSESFEITASSSKKVLISNDIKLSMPIKCEVIKDALRLNASDKFWENNPKQASNKETIKIDNIPDKNEADKYMAQRIPFFRIASEERFRDLFQILRVDAKLNNTYLALMILSTLLAVLGLFANSTAVVIGAMLIAPLMTPIISLSMGLLRADTTMISASLVKIVVGVALALIASSLVTYLLPYSKITPEMIARINPTLLDLGVAVFSGIAAAYSKSLKEITQNLAGVAIAVALVPPLAVAGIGLGYGDFSMFWGAFLLFFTNLIGIILAAVLTFQVVGFSSVVKSKKSMLFIFFILLSISYPLYVSYDNMIEKYKTVQMLKKHRFIVNNKYIIIKDANVLFHGNTKILDLNLLVRDSLTRDDFQLLKEDLQHLFHSKLVIQTRVEYIL
jgi:uncharacterized hydrophobic protein (TIGR00271 family)